jgi:Septum formation
MTFRPKVIAESRSLGVAAVLTLVAVVAGCSSDAKADPTKPANKAVLDVGSNAASTCLLVTDDLPAEVDKLPTIGCDVPHTHEIYATVPYAANDVFPGLAELESFAQKACLTAFDKFVGISVFDSSLSFSWLVPSLDGWNKKKDRDVLCVLQDAKSAQLTGSMRDSKR